MTSRLLRADWACSTHWHNKRCLQRQFGTPCQAVITVIALGNPTAAASSPSAFRLLSTVDALYGAIGNVRAFLAVAGADQVDATSGNPFFSSLVYKNISDYQSVAPGLYRLYFTTPGFDQAILRSALRVDAGGDFTAVLGGQIGGQLGLFQFRADNNAPEAGLSRVRVIHAAAGSPQVSLQLNGNTAGSIMYREFYGYTNVNAGSTVISVTSTDDSSQLYSGSFNLGGGSVVSMFAVGVVGDSTNGFEVVPVTDVVGTPVDTSPQQSSTTPSMRIPVATPQAEELSTGGVISCSFLFMFVAALLIQ